MPRAAKKVARKTVTQTARKAAKKAAKTAPVRRAPAPAPIPAVLVTPPSEAQIRVRATEIWNQRGRPSDEDVANWFEAERQLAAERA